MQSVLYRSFHRIASNRTGLILALGWGVAEALWWPIVPDFLLLALVPLVPRRWWKLAAAASAGSVVGGAFGYALGGTISPNDLLGAAPLITERMAQTARDWLVDFGPPAILRQPLSGIPYKVFVFTGRDIGVDFSGFLLFSAIARSMRIFATGIVAAFIGWVVGKTRTARYYDLFLLAVTISFAVGLWRVVRAFR
jgi:1-acyl-sn-glycerol-3-phosphate acyltransferase